MARLAVAAILVVMLGLPAKAAAPHSRFLILSDLHFDPMADPALVGRLAAAPPAQWTAILDSSETTSLGHYGVDTNWRLLRSALRQMRLTLPHPAFVLIPGDFLAHHFRDTFKTAARDTSEEDYRRFVGKTMRFLAERLEAAFPGTPILPTLGNNDAFCGDYELEPNGPFLADTGPLLRRLLGGVNRSRLGRQWVHYGNYEVALPAARGVRAVFVNTVFFSHRYRNACGASGTDPGRATLTWLAARLAAAQAAHRRVWLVHHIPPGIDGFATWRQGQGCSGTVVPMWAEAYRRPFSALMRRYREIVVTGFAGHTHMDDFRLSGDAAGIFGYTLITPALSPIYGQNPAFRVVAYDADGGVLDQTTYELANLAETGSKEPPHWRAEYSLTRTWRLPRLDLASFTRLYRRIAEVPADRDRWRRLLVVSSPVYSRLGPIDGGAAGLRDLYCATGHTAPADYRRCVCGIRE